MCCLQQPEVLFQDGAWDKARTHVRFVPSIFYCWVWWGTERNGGVLFISVYFDLLELGAGPLTERKINKGPGINLEKTALKRKTRVVVFSNLSNSVVHVKTLGVFDLIKTSHLSPSHSVINKENMDCTFSFTYGGPASSKYCGLKTLNTRMQTKQIHQEKNIVIILTSHCKCT